MTSDRGQRFDPEAYRAALGAAAQRIIPHRRSITLDDAKTIVGEEFERRGVPLSRDTQESHAKFLHRGFFWPFLHPWQARREGLHFVWRSEKDRLDTDSVPVAVEDLANQESWRRAGSGVGPLAEALEPAECQRISRTEYFCVARVPASQGHRAYRVEITISCRRGGSPRVMECVLKQV